MKIKAKFKGRDGSLGYRNGGNYVLEFETARRRIPYSTDFKDVIKITNLSLSGYMGECEYDSLKAFLNNWQVLS